MGSLSVVLYERLLDKAYERYRLDWMLSHDVSISDMISRMRDYVSDADPSEYSNIWGQTSVTAIFADWEKDSGFGGAIWVCKDEFENTEFRDWAYMKRLLSPEYFQLWEEFCENKKNVSEKKIPVWKFCQEEFESLVALRIKDGTIKFVTNPRNGHGVVFQVGSDPHKWLPFSTGTHTMDSIEQLDAATYQSWIDDGSIDIADVARGVSWSIYSTRRCHESLFRAFAQALSKEE